MINIIIIEDEVIAYKKLSKLLHLCEQEINIIDWQQSVFGSVKWLEANDSPDLIFLDIELADGSSFAIFENIKVKCPVIFTTAFDDYALKAFEVNSIDYLLKPFSLDQLQRSLDKYEALTTFQIGKYKTLLKMMGRLEDHKVAYRDRFHVKKGSKILIIKTKDIAWFHTGNYVYLMTNAGDKIVIDYSLDQLMSMLNPKIFYRANRQFIVNIEAIASISTHFNYKLKIILNPPSSSDLFIPKDRAKAFKEWIG